MNNLALLLIATLFAASLLSPALSQDPPTDTEAPAVPLETPNDSAEPLSTSSENKEVGSNRILNYDQPGSVGNGFGAFQSTIATYLPKQEYPLVPPQYPSHHNYVPGGHGHGYPTHQKYYNTGCKHYCPGFVPGTFYCCNKAPLYGGYYCPRIRQSCPASSRHDAPRPCIEDQGCYHGQKCCLDACLGFHICKAAEWR